MDDYVRNKKIINFIILVVIFIFVLVVFIITIMNGKVFSSGDYLIVGDNLVWKKVNNELYQVNPNDEEISGEFTIYNGLDKIKASKVDFKNNKFKFYSGNNVIKIDKFRLAYKGFSNIKVYDSLVDGYDSEDESYILEIANTESEEDYKIFRESLRKINLPDGKGTLYTMSDFVFGNGYRTPYSYMFLVQDEKVVDSLFEIDSNVYNIVDVVDIDGDESYEIVVSKGVSSGNYYDMCHQLYNVKGSNIILKQDCKYINKKSKN